MKIKFCFAACVAALAMIGCNEKMTGPIVSEENVPVGNDEVRLTVDVSDPQTRLTGTYTDKKINKVQLFVFDKLGVLETTATSTTPSVSLTCRNGEKHLVALVNTRTLNDVKTLVDLSKRKVDLKDMSEANEVMVGRTFDTLRADKKVLLTVDRIAAMIVINKLAVNFISQQYLQKPVTIKAMYLINAAGERTYMTDDPTTFWYNEGGYDYQTCPDVIYDKLDNEVIISGNQPSYNAHYFYCYPNGLDKPTRLVIETEIDGETFYYPINIGTILAGNKYICSLNIRNLGSYSPDVPVEEGTVTATFAVSSWKETRFDETVI